jgi:hypothetical protein
MPGATVERVDGDEVAGRVRVKVGPVTASYAGTARFVTKDEAAHRFVLEGSGRETRGAGTASATVEVSMSEQDADTRVRVVTSLEVTGKQAQFAAPQAVSPQSVSAQAAAPQDAAAGSLDLVSTVAMPVLKRFGPVLGGLAFGLVLGLLVGHRRRIVIMTAAAPGSYPPARTVL